MRSRGRPGTPPRVALRLAAWLMLGLAACRIAPATPAPTAAPSPTATVTISLATLLPTLPPTATAPATTLPPPSPTAALPAGVGQVLLSDQFTASESGWSLASNQAGAVALSGGSLNFTVNQPLASEASLFSSPVPADFYVEVTARTLLCDAPKNEFGLIARARRDYHYRIAFSCDGSIRFERYSGPALEGASAWQAAAAVLPGAPAENRLGLLAQGSHFGIYANGALVFSYMEPLLDQGQLGLFAHTERSTVLAVAFDDLLVRSLAAGAQPGE